MEKRKKPVLAAALLLGAQVAWALWKRRDRARLGPGTFPRAADAWDYLASRGVRTGRGQ